MAATTPEDKKWTGKWLPNACQTLMRKAATLEIPTDQTDLPGKLTKANLRQLRFYANGIRQIIGRDIAPAAGLTIGFNELDGD